VEGSSSLAFCIGLLPEKQQHAQSSLSVSPNDRDCQQHHVVCIPQPPPASLHPLREFRVSRLRPHRWLSSAVSTIVNNQQAPRIQPTTGSFVHESGMNSIGGGDAAGAMLGALVALRHARAPALQPNRTVGPISAPCIRAAQARCNACSNSCPRFLLTALEYGAGPSPVSCLLRLAVSNLQTPTRAGSADEPTLLHSTRPAAGRPTATSRSQSPMALSWWQVPLGHCGAPGKVLSW
jgi:hypothetical protein